MAIDGGSGNECYLKPECYWQIQVMFVSTTISSICVSLRRTINMAIDGGSGYQSGRSRLCLLVVQEAADAARLNQMTYCPPQMYTRADFEK